MSYLLREGEPGPHGGFSSVIHKVREWGPIRTLREKREFNSIGKMTMNKLLKDVREGGLLFMPGNPPQKEYWIWLRNNDDRRYAVRAVLDYPKPWRDSVLHVNASDDGLPPGEPIRLFAVDMEPDRAIGSRVPFTSDKWHGDTTMQCHEMTQEEDERPLEMKEKKDFLAELLSAEIDRSTTEREFQQARQRSESAYWVNGAHISYWT